MAVLCPRCGEYSSILDEHCKKCGFSIKNYLDNRKKFGADTVSASANSSSSVCVKEEKITLKTRKNNDNSDEIQENIMRLLNNVKIIPDKNKVEENEKIEENVQSVLESALNETIKQNNVAAESKKNAPEQGKKEAVKIVAKKVANDVIILPPNRVKVEIEASKEVKTHEDVNSEVKNVEAKKTEVKKVEVKNKVEKIEPKVEIKTEQKAVEPKVEIKEEIKVVESKIEQKNAEKKAYMKAVLMSEKKKTDTEENKVEEKSDKQPEVKKIDAKLGVEEKVDSKEENTVSEEEKKAIEETIDEEQKKLIEERAINPVIKENNTEDNDKDNNKNAEEDKNRFVHYSDGVLFNNFVEETRKNNDTLKMAAMVGGFIVVLVIAIILVTTGTTTIH